MDTPLHAGKTVKISFLDVMVHLEGKSAFVPLLTQDSEIMKKNIAIIDIGGVTTDISVIENAQINNRFSYAKKIGVSSTLDAISNRVDSQFQYRFSSRNYIVQTIAEKDCKIQRLATNYCIKDIVKDELTKTANLILKELLYLWNNVDLDTTYFVGGGSALLKEYLFAEMEKQNLQLPIKFQPLEESVWAIVSAYDVLLERAIKQVPNRGGLQ